MEWNWKMKNGMIDVTPFFLFESSADSDDAIADSHHHHQQKQEEEEEEDQDAMEDDAESCSYNHSFQTNAKTHDTHLQAHEDDDGYGHGHDDDDQEDIDDDDDKNWGESKMMGQEKTYHELCVDSSNLDPGNQSDIDRRFWETCLGS